MTDTDDNLIRVATALTPVMSEPSPDSICTSEALYGEYVSVLDQHDTWCRIRQVHDGYEGFVCASDLQLTNLAGPAANTHWVTQRSTLLFREPDFKSPVVHRIPFAAELALTEQLDDHFSRTSCGYYVWTAHCLPLDETCVQDALQIARSRFLGCPYRWGGRSPKGADCSGLVQMLARSQGLSLPRDSGEQEAFLDGDISFDERQSLDLVYWPGHTGILVSPDQVLHATAHSLACVEEPLQAVIDRAGQASSVKRLFSQTTPVRTCQPA